MSNQSGGPLHAWGARTIADAVRRREVSARQAVQAALDRIEDANPGINAVVEVHASDALSRADLLDRRLAAGEDIGPLGGVPITTKINTDLAGWPTTNGVRANLGLVAGRTNPAIENLLAAGAIIVGRTNVPAYSWRWFTDNALYGPTLNPWSGRHTPGGSSGGAAAAVCLGMGSLAHGTDYAGSIRLPAGNCGVAGLRPTVGRVPSYNATAPEERPLSVQMMSVQGLLARDVGDIGLALGPMSGGSPLDPWWVPPISRLPGDTSKRVGLCTGIPGFRVDPDIRDQVVAAGQALADAGYAVEEVALPSFEEMYRLWLTLYAAEGRAFMAEMLERNGGPDVARAAGLVFDMAPGVDGNVLLKSYARRTAFARAWAALLADVPVVVCPNSGMLPMEVGLDVAGPGQTEAMLRALSWQVVPPLAGVPALAVPVSMAKGLPVAMQLIAARFREDLCLEVGTVLQRAFGFPGFLQGNPGDRDGVDGVGIE